MNDDTPHRGWFERLSHALLREPQDREQLIELLHDANERDLLDDDAMHMIEGVLQVSQMKVRDIMIPRPQMVVIHEHMTPSEAIPIIIEAGHSRYPVIGEKSDKIIGILLAKDLLQLSETQHHIKAKPLHIRDLIRPATFIPESKRLDVLLKEFRLTHNHMAIVVDEYGNIDGLITIEDVLEQIVGDIEDEYDTAEEEPNIKQISDAEFRVKALTPIEEFNHYFATEFDDEDYDTVGGLILQQFSHLPKQGESILIGAFQITVLQASHRGIQLLRVTHLNEDNET